MRILILLLLVGFNGFGQSKIIEKKGISKTVSFEEVLSLKQIFGSTYVVDGKFISKNEFQNIKPETIESISIINGDSIRFGCARRDYVIIATSKKTSKRAQRKMKKKIS